MDAPDFQPISSPFRPLPPLAEELRALGEGVLAATPLGRRLAGLKLSSRAVFQSIDEGRAVHASIDGRYYRFAPSEATLAMIVGRSSTYSEILDAYWQETGLLIAPEALHDFLGTLLRFGLLHDGTDGPESVSRRSPPQSLPQLRFPLSHPDPWMDAMAPVGRLIFSRPFVLASLPAIAMAFWMALRHVGPIASPGESGALLVGLVLITALHELGHALCCRRWGARVPEMGIMIYWFMPMGYCDVSAAAMLPRKRHRLYVSLAGIYVQALVGVLAVAIWRFVPMSVAGRAYAIQLAALCLLANLLNLNPLLKLDGYFILTDLLETPNLRARAFRYLGSLITRKEPCPKSWGDGMLALYGIVGGLCTLGFAWEALRLLAHLAAGWFPAA